MDEVVNRFGFSGIVSLLSLQAWIVFTRKPCRRPTCLCDFTALLWLPEFTALYRGMLATLNSCVRLKKMAPYLLTGWCAYLVVFILVPVPL